VFVVGVLFFEGLVVGISELETWYSSFLGVVVTLKVIAAFA